MQSNPVVELVEDNIAADQADVPAADEPVAPVTGVAAVEEHVEAAEESPEYKKAFDEYEKLFGEVQDMSEDLTVDLGAFEKCEHDQSRVRTLVAYVKSLQSYNEKLLTLIIMLNNIAAGQLPTGGQ